MYPARVLKTPQKGYFTVWGSGDSVFLFYDDDDDVQPRGTPFRFCTPCAYVYTLYYKEASSVSQTGGCG
jgi:hypothetical protein